MALNPDRFNLPAAGGHADLSHPAAHHIYGNPGMRPTIRDKSNPDHIAEDLHHLQTGVLDPDSFVNGYVAFADPVVVLVHNPDGTIKCRRHTHNIRTNNGGNWLVKLMGGGGLTSGVTGTATATSATSLTSAAITAVTANQFAGQILVAGAVFGVILSNTSGTTPVCTIDQWYTVGSATGASGTTPSSTATYVILPGQMPAAWLALSTDSVTPNTTDSNTLASEITSGTNSGLVRSVGTWSQTTTPSASSTSTNQTAAYQLQKTFTSAATTNSVQKCGMYLGQNGTIMTHENTFSSTNLINGDTLQLTWTVTCN